MSDEPAPDSAKSLRDALLDEGTSRHTRQVNLGDFGDCQVRVMKRREARRIGRDAQKIVDSDEHEIDDVETAREALMVVRCTYKDGEQVFSEAHLDRFGETRAQQGDWYDRLTDAIAYAHGWIDEPPAGTDDHYLRQILDRTDQLTSAIEEDDRLDDGLSKDLRTLVEDIEEIAKDAQSEADENLILR